MILSKRVRGVYFFFEAWLAYLVIRSLRVTALQKATSQNWESGRAGGLTKKGADRVLKAYQREHILCTHDWLLQGVGASPVLMDESRDPAAHRAHAVFSGLAEDIAYLRSLYDHVVDLPIADQSMMPDYPQSAHVVGISHYKEQILSSVGKDCIVHAVGHPPIFRRLLSSGDAQRFHLVPLSTSLATILSLPMLKSYQ